MSENPHPFEIVDYATGVKGTFCIAQRVSGAPAYRAYWNPSGWAGSGYVFLDKLTAESVVDLLRKIADLQSQLAEERAKMQPTESMEEIAKLANFIMEEIPGEPSASESAVDVAIRLLRSERAKRGELTFAGFSRANRARCESQNGFNHKLSSWSASDWITATTGELGEMANIVKKLNRVRDGIPGNDKTPEELEAAFADELADVFIYLDLLAQSRGVNLAQAVIAKFNKSSAKIGYPETLDPSASQAFDAMQQREQKLRELVAKWREKVAEGIGPTDRMIGISRCADELEAALAESAKETKK